MSNPTEGADTSVHNGETEADDRERLRLGCGEKSVSTIWHGFSLEVAYRTGLPPLKALRLIEEGAERRWPDEDWDTLFEPVVVALMDAAGLRDTRFD